MDFAHSILLTPRSGGIERCPAARDSPAFMAREYERSKQHRGAAIAARSATASPQTARVRRIAFGDPGALQLKNASRVLFDTCRRLGSSLARTGPAGARSYQELCAELFLLGNASCRWYCRAATGIRDVRWTIAPIPPRIFSFGAFVPAFVAAPDQPLTTAGPVQFYLADSVATVAVTDADSRALRFAAFKDRLLHTRSWSTAMPASLVPKPSRPRRLSAGISLQELA